MHFIRGQTMPIFLHISLSWLIGSLLTSFLTSIFSVFIPISSSHTFFIFAFQLMSSFFGYKYLLQQYSRSFFSRFGLKMERSSNFYLCLFIIALTFVIFFYYAFSHFPYKVPKDFEESISTGYSFVNSLLKGVNHVSFLFKYHDPQYYNDTFHSPILPYVYTALLCSFGAKYHEAITLISYANTISIISAGFLYGKQYCYQPTFFVLIYLLNSGWGFLRAFFGNPSDLVHNINERIPVPWYQTLSYSFSNPIISYSIACALFSSIFIQLRKEKSVFREYFMLGIFLIILCPSPATSLSISFFSSGNPSFTKYSIILSTITSFRTFFYHHLYYFPLFREYQMKRGTMYAWIVIWWDALGPLFISLFFGIFFSTSIQEFQRTCLAYSVFALLSLFQVGNNHNDNITAIMSVVFPIIVVNFINMFHRIYQTYFSRDQYKSGIFKGVFYIIVFCYIIGGFISIYRTVSPKNMIPYLSDFDIECGNWFLNQTIIDFKYKDVPILAYPEPNIPPALIAGKQLFIGDYLSVWKNDGKVLKDFSNFQQLIYNENILKILSDTKIKYILENVKSNYTLSFIKNFGSTKLKKICSNPTWILYEYLKK